MGPFRLLTRRMGPVGLVFTAYDVWRRLPPSQRRRLIEASRTHGPRIAAGAAQRVRGRRDARKRDPKP